MSDYSYFCHLKKIIPSLNIIFTTLNSNRKVTKQKICLMIKQFPSMWRKGTYWCVCADTQRWTCRLLIIFLLIISFLGSSHRVWSLQLKITINLLWNSNSFKILCVLYVLSNNHEVIRCPSGLQIKAYQIGNMIWYHWYRQYYRL